MIIYITGAPRCGKTTLTERLHRELDNSIIVSLDALSKAVRSVFKDFKLYDGIAISPNVNREKFLSLVERYICSFSVDYPKADIIVEGCHFTPDEFKNCFHEAKIICLGITSSIENCLNAVNTSEWMSRLPNKDKLIYAEKIFEYSNILKAEKNYFEQDNIDTEAVIKLLKSAR